MFHVKIGSGINIFVILQKLFDNKFDFTYALL